MERVTTGKLTSGNGCLSYMVSFEGFCSLYRSTSHFTTDVHILSTFQQALKGSGMPLFQVSLPEFPGMPPSPCLTSVILWPCSEDKPTLSDSREQIVQFHDLISSWRAVFPRQHDFKEAQVLLSLLLLQISSWKIQKFPGSFLGFCWLITEDVRFGCLGVWSFKRQRSNRTTGISCCILL